MFSAKFRQTSPPPSWHTSPTRRLATARHEAGHALRAHTHDFKVIQIHLNLEGGAIAVAFPLATAEVGAAYHGGPERTARQILGIIETILAGAAIDSQALKFDDQALLGAYKLAWPLGALPSWDTLYSRAQVNVAQWARHPATQAAVETLARHLLTAPSYRLEGAALQAALAAATGQPAPRRAVANVAGRPVATKHVASPAPASQATAQPVPAPARKPSAPPPVPRPVPPPQHDLAAALGLLARYGLGDTGRWGRSHFPGFMYGSFYA